MQTALVIVIVLAAIAYAVYRLRLVLHRIDDPCAGCNGCECGLKK